MQALTSPELNGNLRKQCLHLLYKVCKACKLLPSSYVLRKELTCLGDIRSYGGFADVSEGEYLGRRVAIKNLRFGMRDALDNIFKVPQLYLRCSIVAQFAPAVLPGSYRLEASLSPKHLASVGSLRLHESPMFPYRL